MTERQIEGHGHDRRLWRGQSLQWRLMQPARVELSKPDQLQLRLQLQLQLQRPGLLCLCLKGLRLWSKRLLCLSRQALYWGHQLRRGAAHLLHRHLLHHQLEVRMEVVAGVEFQIGIRSMTGRWPLLCLQLELHPSLQCGLGIPEVRLVNRYLLAPLPLPPLARIRVLDFPPFQPNPLSWCCTIWCNSKSFTLQVFRWSDQVGK